MNEKNIDTQFAASKNLEPYMTTNATTSEIEYKFPGIMCKIKFSFGIYFLLVYLIWKYNFKS